MATPSDTDRRMFIRRLFGQIAGRYDLVNRLLTGGRDLYWRRQLAEMVRLRPGERVLDLACGTGDQGRALLKTQQGVHLIGADPVSGMLHRAGPKIPAAGLVCCEAEALPFTDDCFQVATVTFGVRNFTALEKGLGELHRVLAEDGRLGVLEFARPRRGPLAPIFHWYLTRVLPRVGGLFSPGYAYRYLPDSIRHFPDPDRFTQLLAAAGFTGISTRSFLGGTVWIYVGIKDRANGGITS
ncbi:MAG: ubiquinone/menaquinone biosynthesis methyltransferase [Candidatus Neomarinimicrobiota bacterium]